MSKVIKPARCYYHVMFWELYKTDEPPEDYFENPEKYVQSFRFRTMKQAKQKALELVCKHEPNLAGDGDCGAGLIPSMDDPRSYNTWYLERYDAVAVITETFDKRPYLVHVPYMQYISDPVSYTEALRRVQVMITQWGGIQEIKKEEVSNGYWYWGIEHPEYKVFIHVMHFKEVGLCLV